VSYDFKFVKAYLQGQYIKTNFTTSTTGDIKHIDGQAGVSVPVGAGNVLASYTFGRVLNEVTSIKRNTFGVAYDYNLSKRTDVYAAYYYDKVTGVEHGDTFGVGVRHRF